MVQPDGTPHTAHTMNPVPFIHVSPDGDARVVREGALCDVAPTILDLLGIPQPDVMTGRSLLEKRPA